MDIERITAEMLALEQWLDEDDPPLLGLIVLASGRRLDVSYPLLEDRRRRLDDRHAALTLLRKVFADCSRKLDEELTAIERAGIRGRNS